MDKIHLFFFTTQLKKEGGTMSKEEKRKIILDQIAKIRDSGKTNMLDINGVINEANQHSFYELIVFIEDHQKEYLELLLN